MCSTFLLFLLVLSHYKFLSRWGGMPEMTFEWALRENGIDPKKDLNIDTSVAFAAMSSAFIGGQGDFVTLFDDSAKERMHKKIIILS